MKVKLPFVGFIEKTIQADIVRAFLGVFRDTQDIHRVLIIIPWTLFLSHCWHIKNAPQTSLIVANLNREEIIWIGLASFMMLFILSWAVFSSEFNPSLYFRQLIIGGWTFLIHRLVYGLTMLGSPDFYLLSFAAFSYFLPFAITGLTPKEFFQKLKDDREAKKNHEPAFIDVQQSESNAA